MRPDSMSVTMAKVTRRIEDCGGRVAEDRLEQILHEFGITQQVQNYKTKLVEYGYLKYDRVERRYRLTEASTTNGTITVRVRPSQIAEEVRLQLVATFARYPGIIEIGEVE